MSYTKELTEIQRRNQKLDKHNLREVHTTKPALQQITREIL